MKNDLDAQTVVQILWRRKWLMAACAGVGLVIGALAYLKTTPSYQSEAQVLVVKKRPEAVTGDSADMSQPEDYISTHRILILSRAVVERAVREGKLRNLRTFAHESGDLADSVAKKLSLGKVLRDGQGNPLSVLSLAFRGPVAEECGTVVNAVLDSYRGFLEETYRNLGDDSVKLIAEARQILQNDIEKREAAYRAFREKSPLLWRGNTEVNPLQERLVRIETQRSTLLLRKADLEGQLNTLESARQRGKSRESLLALVSDLSSKEDKSHTDANGPASLRSQVLPLVLDDRTLSAGYGPKHPEVQAVRQRIEATHNFSILPASVAIERATAGETNAASGGGDLVAAYVEYLNQQRDQVVAQEATLATLFESEHEAVRKLSVFEIEDAQFRNDIARTEALCDGLVKRSQQVALAKNYGGYEARVIAPAGMGLRVAPSLSFMLAASLGVALFLGAGLAVAAEARANRFYNHPNDVGGKAPRDHATLRPVKPMHAVR